MLGALDGEEALTPLGQHLSKMPVDIRLAKTLIYASMLRWVLLQYYHVYLSAAGNRLCKKHLCQQL